MELRRITDHSHETLMDYYEEFRSFAINKGWNTIWQDRMIALVRHLENEVDGPPQWVTTSHGSVLYMGDVDFWDTWKARVFISGSEENGFEIRYRSAPEFDWDNSFTKLYASDVIEAGKKVKEALDLALPDPPGRFEARS